MVVTISREFGAAGLAVAHAVAGSLGYALVTDDIANKVAARLGTSADEVAARAEVDKSLPERMLGDLGAGTVDVMSLDLARPPYDFDETLRREVEIALRERAAVGDVVILGRNAGAVLGNRPDLVRVFLTADREWRIRRIAEAFGTARNDAIADIERTDAARRRFAKDRYKVGWGEGRFYDLIVDVSRFGVDGTVSLIVRAVRAAEAE